MEVLKCLQGTEGIHLTERRLGWGLLREWVRVPHFTMMLTSLGPTPGMSAPPGLQQSLNNAQQPAPGRPGAYPANFQAPPNMSNINFSAPVIRLGAAAPVKPQGFAGLQSLGGLDSRARPGLGMEQAQSCLLYTSPSPRDGLLSRMPSSA